MSAGTLTPRQIAVVAGRAGFRGSAQVKAVAVALAESGGRTNAVGVNSDKWHSRDRGLWQINDHWHPDVSDKFAFNPDLCAQAAFRISHGGRDWSPWSTWNNGSAQAQMGRARLAVKQAGTSSGPTPGGFDPSLGGLIVPGQTSPPLTPSTGGWAQNSGVANAIGDGARGLLDGAGNVIGAVTDPLEAVAGFFAWIADPHHWLRVAMVVGGTGGVLLGLEMLAKSGALGSGASAVAALPAKAAKAATAVI